MKKSSLILLLLILGNFNSEAITNGVTSEKVKTYSKEEIRAYFDELGLKKIIVPANNGIDVYRILYQMPDINNNLTDVSGLILVPQGATKPLPLLRDGKEIT